MIKKILLFSALSLVVYAATTTTTTFVEGATAHSDKYGNSVSTTSVIIETKDFKVENFWSKFFDSTKGQSLHSSISTSATFNIITEATSACVLDGTLAEEGCSGQKPFLINDDLLNNPISGTTDEFEVAFSLANGFDKIDNQSFYPLDILRDAKYYQDPYPSDSTAGINRGFFGFFTSAFDFMFDKIVGADFFGDPDIADVEYTIRGDAAQERRQRYIANIIAGIDKNHRMTKELDGATATEIKAYTKLNTPASLLHYAEAKKTTESDQCKFIFLNLSNDGFMCRMMGGFGMDAWMPFFNQTQSTKIEVNTIMGDTENALLAMTGKIENVPYMEDVGGTDDDKLYFLQNMLKPMTTMISFMKNMLFGSTKETIVADPVERVYTYADNKAMTMGFAITNDGNQIDDFANFKLLKIRSVYGDMINSCKVKKSWAFMNPGWTKTFVEDGTQSVKSPDSSGWHPEMWNDNEWISWCQTATGRIGMFDALFDWSTGGIFNPINWMTSFFGMFTSFFSSSYDITNFTSTLKRGLILNLKKVDLNSSYGLNKQTIEIMKIEQGK